MLLAVAGVWACAPATQISKMADAMPVACNISVTLSRNSIIPVSPPAGSLCLPAAVMFDLYPVRDNWKFLACANHHEQISGSTKHPGRSFPS
jgi:hypothetical protein